MSYLTGGEQHRRRDWPAVLLRLGVLVLNFVILAALIYAGWEIIGWLQ